MSFRILYRKEKYMNRRVILASGSPRRKELLHQIGLEPEVIPSQVEEKVTSQAPELVVMELARQKAEDVAAGQNQGDIIIGADTVVALEHHILGKPGSEKEAEEMISMLQGKVHQVYTGVAIICKGEGKERNFAVRTDVEVFPMTPEEIRSYVATGEPMDKAGAYGIQGRFAAFIRGITGDYNNVVGLPVGSVYQILKEMDKENPDD